MLERAGFGLGTIRAGCHSAATGNSGLTGGLSGRLSTQDIKIKDDLKSDLGTESTRSRFCGGKTTVMKEIAKIKRH